jgi:ribosomal protein S12 methylthiotransferase accessory factor
LLTLQNSVRIKSPHETWKEIQPLLQTYGITRVTNTTWLDRIGLPVYAAIRPNALKGSLCVSSGKGLTEIDAKVGAAAEAIELAAAQWNPERDQLFIERIGILREQADLDLYDFGVIQQSFHKISEKTEVKFVKVTELFSGKDFLIPASLVFLPFEDQVGTALYGQTSNGISGGNSQEESLLHAILEVIERDILSFARIGKFERLVEGIDDPTYESTLRKINHVGLELFTTFCENIYGLPMFISYMFDQEYWNGVSICRGQGVHVSKKIAAFRAISESAQSRLTNIHGGRDDIVKRFSFFEKQGFSDLSSAYQKVRDRIRALPSVSYREIDDQPLASSVETTLKNLKSKLFQLGFRHIFHYKLTPLSSKFQVHKVIIPGMEFYDPVDLPRIGKRIISYKHKNG